MPQPVPQHAPQPMKTLTEKLIVALDVDSATEARSLVRELNGSVGAFKVGLQLFSAEGGRFVTELVDSGARIFLDLKFHDIPNTVAKASVEAARMGVWMFNMHASGGGEMMSRSVAEVEEFCVRSSNPRPLMIAVTVLTSSDEATLSETGVGGGVEKQVSRLAVLASESGIDGVVASSQEVGLIRSSVKRREFVIVTPGIRPADASMDDQRRVMGPGDALVAGSDFLVVGRPIVKAEDRLGAVELILKDMESKFSGE